MRSSHPRPADGFRAATIARQTYMVVRRGRTYAVSGDECSLVPHEACSAARARHQCAPLPPRHRILAPFLRVCRLVGETDAVVLCVTVPDQTGNQSRWRSRQIDPPHGMPVRMRRERPHDVAGGGQSFPRRNGEPHGLHDGQRHAGATPVAGQSRPVRLTTPPPSAHRSCTHRPRRQARRGPCLRGHAVPGLARPREQRRPKRSRGSRRNGRRGSRGWTHR